MLAAVACQCCFLLSGRDDAESDAPLRFDCALAQTVSEWRLGWRHATLNATNEEFPVGIVQVAKHSNL